MGRIDARRPRRVQPLGLVGDLERRASFRAVRQSYSAADQTRREGRPLAFEFQRALVFPEGLQIGFEKPESSLRIDRVNAGRSKAHYSTLLFPYNLLRVFYVTRRFGEIVNFSAHWESLQRTSTH